MKKFKWWWSWTSEAFEQYLEDMAAKGYCLKSAQFGMMWLEFETCEPKKIRYCVDYRNKVEDDYITILKDDGWDYVAKNAGWLLWSKAYDDKRPSLFTDPQSLIDRNRRIMALVVILLTLQGPNMMMNIYSRLNSMDPGIITIALIYTTLVGLMVYGVVRMLIENHTLKGSSQGRESR